MASCLLGADNGGHKEWSDVTQQKDQGPKRDYMFIWVTLETYSRTAAFSVVSVSQARTRQDWAKSNKDGKMAEKLEVFSAKASQESKDETKAKAKEK